jgi:P27 family predicted phage terminase small subunit
MRGRRPKPSKIKELAGNPGRRPLPDEPQIPASWPQAPKWLSQEAKREWRRLRHILEPLGYVTQADRAALVGYCNAYARAHACQRHVEQHGPVLANGRANPAFKLQGEAETQLRHYMGELGLSPAMRSKIQLPPRQDAEPQGAAKYLRVF